ncbi:formate dehydrogenase (NAD+) [Phytophthora pseudosyringae]|uniref:Formate dehydrogenase (NAD+) n=1 Tax=Phytophthora pseudosyringae TaxID=221518 RepID=A0A8T1VB66_9STRA|nr:formate dehydrogenase (NAD+) [Phytophthora pseudosyringae]
MNRSWGVRATPDERLGAEAIAKIAQNASEQRAAAPRALGKRHAATSPAELNEVLELCGPRSSPEGEDAAVSSAKSDTSQEAVAKPNRPRKHRKSTHVVRKVRHECQRLVRGGGFYLRNLGLLVVKEEKERLLKEMAGLSAQLASLKQQAMASMGRVDRDTARSIQVGRELRDDVHVNQQKFGEIASIMSEFSLCNAQAGSALHDKIMLKRDQDSRRTALRALKASKMPKAEQFLQLRRPNTNLRNICDEGRRFEMDNGDFFSERLSITQFKDARSVKQIFDLLLFYYCNLEISISEKIGHITVRLDDDNGNKSITQNRLVSTTIKDLKVESNTITFAHFHEPRDDEKCIHGEGDYGMIVMDYADGDEKYPYQPGECIRKDVVAVMEVRECPLSPKDEDRVTVVFTRWVQNKLHRPQFPVASKDWHELRDRMDLFGKTMQRSLAEDLHIEALGLRMSGK